jgi:hypothetical protein
VGVPTVKSVLWGRLCISGRCFGGRCR